MNIEKFKSEMNLRRTTKTTITGYLSDLQLFNKFLNKPTDYEPTKDDVRAYIFYLQSKNRSAATINRHFAAIRRYFLHQERAHELQLIAATLIPRIEQKDVTFLSEEETDKIFETCDRLITTSSGATQLMYIRDKVLIYVLFITGLRRAELLALQEQDIEFDANGTGRLRVSRVKRKKSKMAFIPMNERDIQILQTWLQVKPKSLWLFPSDRDPNKAISTVTCWYRVKRMAEKAGIPGVYPHKWRHSCASQQINFGIPLDEVANFLGHQSVDTTRNFYVSLTDSYIKERANRWRSGPKNEESKEKS